MTKSDKTRISVDVSDEVNSLLTSMAKRLDTSKAGVLKKGVRLLEAALDVGEKQRVIIQDENGTKREFLL